LLLGEEVMQHQRHAIHLLHTVPRHPLRHPVEMAAPAQALAGCNLLSSVEMATPVAPTGEHPGCAHAGLAGRTCPLLTVVDEVMMGRWRRRNER
jgi:hypothetical protein